VVSDYDEKLMALRRLCEKYAISNMENFEAEVAGSLNKVCVCKVNIESISGKSNM
jgi:hypothetical protein